MARAPSNATSTALSEEEHIKQIKAKIGYYEFIFLLAALMAINALAIDIMLPGLQEMAHDLHIAVENDQHYIIFAYLIGFGLTQLAFGPLSDRYGRKPPLLFGLVVYAIAAIFCVFADSFPLFLLCRVIQGMGAAATRVLIVSMMRDLYYGREMARVMSIIMMVFMLVPVLAPATGQLLMLMAPWEITFIFMAGFAIVLIFWVYFRLPETLYEPRALSFSSIITSFKMVFTNRISFCYALAFSVMLGGLFGMLNTAEQVYNGIFHLGKFFPLAFAAVAVSQVIAAFLNAHFVERLGMHRISHTMLTVFCIGAFIWSLWTYLNDNFISFYPYMILSISVMFSFGTVGANFNSLAMEPLGKIAGTASAVFGFLQTMIGASLGFVISQQFNGTTTPIAFGFLGVGLAALLLVLIAEKGKLFRPTHDEEYQNN